MSAEDRVERWATAWRKYGRDADEIFAWARTHGDMDACLAGLLRSGSYKDSISEADRALTERIGDEVFAQRVAA